MNIWNCTVKNNICLDCGICEMVCTTKCIAFDFNHKMIFDKKKCVNCGLCIKYCPSISSNRNDKEELLHERMRGTYIKAYVGRIKDLVLLRKTVSGGAVTKTILELLKNGTYEFAVGVDSVTLNQQVKMKVYDLSTYSDSIPRSVYVMPSYREIIQYINDNSEKKGIIVGSGCVIKILRNYIRESTKLREDNYLLIGLFCDATLNHNICNYLSRIGGKDTLYTELEFRSKFKSGWPGNVLLKTNNGKKVSIPREERYKVVSIFKNRRCMLCLDHMNTQADISIGDNYTGEHSDLLGSNSIVIRTDKGMNALKLVRDNMILYEVDYEKIINSQGIPKKETQYWIAEKFYEETGIEINPKIRMNENYIINEKEKNIVRKQFRIKKYNKWMENTFLVTVMTICRKMSSVENRFLTKLAKMESNRD